VREQVVTPRAGRGGVAAAARAKGRAVGGGQAAQRPGARRAKASGGGKTGQRQRVFTWRRAVRYAPTAAKFVLAVVAGLLVFTGYRAAASASFFQLKTVEVVGSTRSSRDEISDAVRRVVGAGGVWNADLDALTHELSELPWVRAAHAQRVLPSGLRVRVVEREPRMVARTMQGRLVWVDDEGVRLGSASPEDGDFFVRGLEEDREDGARARNRERMELAVLLRDDWARAGVVGRVSEVNLHDLRDVRVQLQGDDSGIEVRLGGGDYAALFRTAIDVLDERRHDPDAQRVNYILMLPGKAPVLGLPANARPAPGGVSETGAPAVARPAPARDGSAGDGAARRRGGERRRVEQNRGDAAAGDAPRGAVRERRVGRG
jgi:cell division septal protein FtsQ